MSKRALALSAAFAVLAFAGAASAKDPVINGMWSISPPDGGQQMRQGNPPPLKPEVRAYNAETQRINNKYNRLIGEAHTKCWPTGMPGMMGTPFGIEFLQTPGRITILNEVSNLPRTIYLDEKEHPDTYIPGWNGHSIGHWEKGVLMVDTVGFNGRNQNVSEKMHMKEKFYLDKDGYLWDEMTLEDPDTYTGIHTMKYRYKRAVGPEANEVMEYVCEVDPTNLVAYEKEQLAEGRKSETDPAWAAEAFSKPDTDAAKVSIVPKNPLAAK
jgi:hypothetical protein